MFGVAYNMLADVYTMTRSRDEAGQWVTEWDYENPLTIACSARYVPIEGFSASDRELYNELAFDKSFVHLRTRTRIPGGDEIRIGNIRHVDRYGRVERPMRLEDGSSAEFIVTGGISKQEPWARVVEWHYVLETPES